MRESSTNVCRLCIQTCKDFKNLYDDNGRTNELYKLIFEYFHPKIVDMHEFKHLTVICYQCFQQIYEFHSFQTSILMAQLKLIDSAAVVIKADADNEFYDEVLPWKTTENSTFFAKETERINVNPDLELKSNCSDLSLAELQERSTVARLFNIAKVEENVISLVEDTNDDIQLNAVTDAILQEQPQKNKDNYSTLTTTGLERSIQSISKDKDESPTPTTPGLRRTIQTLQNLESLGLANVEDRLIPEPENEETNLQPLPNLESVSLTKNKSKDSNFRNIEDRLIPEPENEDTNLQPASNLDSDSSIKDKSKAITFTTPANETHETNKSCITMDKIKIGQETKLNQKTYSCEPVIVSDLKSGGLINNDYSKKLFQCHICSQSYMYENTLKLHMERKHRKKTAIPNRRSRRSLAGTKQASLIADISKSKNCVISKIPSGATHNSIRGDNSESRETSDLIADKSQVATQNEMLSTSKDNTESKCLSNTTNNTSKDDIEREQNVLKGEISKASQTSANDLKLSHQPVTKHVLVGLDSQAASTTESHRGNTNNEHKKRFYCNKCSASYAFRCTLQMHMDRQHIERRTYKSRRTKLSSLAPDSGTRSDCVDISKSKEIAKVLNDPIPESNSIEDLISKSSGKKGTTYKQKRTKCKSKKMQLVPKEDLAIEQQTTTTPLNRDKNQATKHSSKSKLPTVANSNIPISENPNLTKLSNHKEIKHPKSHRGRHSGYKQRLKSHMKQNHRKRRKEDIYFDYDEETKKFGCRVCDKWYIFKQTLMKHMSRQHWKIYVEREAIHGCDKCDKKFHNKSGLHYHRKVMHSSNTLQVCHACRKKFTNYWGYRQHRYGCLNRKTLAADKYKCKLCPKKFRYKLFLTTHIRKLHAKESYPSRVKCKVCGHCFTAVNRLKSHLNVKHPEYDITTNKFKCKECGCLFRRKHSLDIHKQLKHKKCSDTTQRFNCDSCESLYASKRSLNFHISSRHLEQYISRQVWFDFDYDDDNKLFVCRLCASRYKLRVNLSRHMEKMHPKVWEFAKKNSKISSTIGYDNALLSPDSLGTHKLNPHDANSRLKTRGPHKGQRKVEETKSRKRDDDNVRENCGTSTRRRKATLIRGKV